MSDYNSLVTTGRNEVATTREAQLVLAKINARYIMAERHPRDIIKEVEPAIAEVCSRKEFAEVAKYNVVVGGHYDKKGNWIKDYDEDLNIRAAEQLQVCYRNIFDEVMTTYEDSELRRVSFEMTDLETGITHRDEFTIYKTQERKKLKKNKEGKIVQEAIGERINSKGEKIFIVACTPEEVQKKQNAQVSRKMRKMFFRLFPIHLKIKARKYIEDTLRKEIKKNLPDERAKITIAFSKHGVTGDDLEGFIGKTIKKFTEEDIIKLRGIYGSIEEGINTWDDYLSSPSKEEIPETKVELEAKEEPVPPKEETPKEPPKQEKKAAAKTTSTKKETKEDKHLTPKKEAIAAFIKENPGLKDDYLNEINCNLEKNNKSRLKLSINMIDPKKVDGGWFPEHVVAGFDLLSTMADKKKMNEQINNSENTELEPKNDDEWI
jgi:hypothetical protein